MAAKGLVSGEGRWREGEFVSVCLGRWNGSDGIGCDMISGRLDFIVWVAGVAFWGQYIRDNCVQAGVNDIRTFWAVDGGFARGNT